RFSCWRWRTSSACRSSRTGSWSACCREAFCNAASPKTSRRPTIWSLRRAAKGLRRKSSASANWTFGGLAANVSPWWGVPLFWLVEFRSFQRGPVQVVVFRDLELLQPVPSQDFAHDYRAGDDHGRPLRIEPGHLPPLGERQGGQPFELLLHGVGAETVTVQALPLVLANSEVQRGERCDRSRHPDAPRDFELGHARSHVRGACLDVLAEALGQAHATEVEAGVEVDALRPTSATSVCSASSRPAATPRKVRSASSSPESSLVANP